MVFELAMATAAITAATQAIGLFDRISDQVVRFKTRRPASSGPPGHGMTIKESDGDLVSLYNGTEQQRITADQLADLPEDQLRHIRTHEKSMENYYAIWERVYPQLALLGPMEQARTELQLADTADHIGQELEAILSFLESCGLMLDDHYLHARAVLAGP